MAALGGMAEEGSLADRRLANLKLAKKQKRPMVGRCLGF